MKVLPLASGDGIFINLSPEFWGPYYPIMVGTYVSYIEDDIPTKFGPSSIVMGCKTPNTTNFCAGG